MARIRDQFTSLRLKNKYFTQKTEAKGLGFLHSISLIVNLTEIDQYVKV
jgi:hypothetical protein